MKKFNVSGVVLANIFANGIEANSKEEAINKMKEMLENNRFVDWTDWHDIDVSEVIDYSEKVREVLKIMGHSDYKVIGVPEIVFEYDGFGLFTVMVDCGNSSGKVFFIELDNGEIYLPVVQRCTSMISLNYMCNDKPFEENLNKVFFSNGKKIVFFVPKVKAFASFEDDGIKSLFGQRIQFIIEKTGLDEWTVNTSDVFSLELTSADKNIDLDAEYENPLDIVPCRLTKIESII